MSNFYCFAVNYWQLINKAALRQDKNTCACTIFTRNLYLEQVVYPYVLKYRRHRKHYYKHKVEGHNVQMCLATPRKVYCYQKVQ